MLHLLLVLGLQVHLALPGPYPCLHVLQPLVQVLLELVHGQLGCWSLHAPQQQLHGLGPQLALLQGGLLLQQPQELQEDDLPLACQPQVRTWMALHSISPRMQYIDNLIVHQPSHK